APGVERLRRSPKVPGYRGAMYATGATHARVGERNSARRRHATERKCASISKLPSNRRTDAHASGDGRIHDRRHGDAPVTILGRPLTRIAIKGTLNVGESVVDSGVWRPMAKSKSRPQPHAERVLIQRTHYAGRDYITIRAWWSGENGKWYPSKDRGINLRADMFAPDA